MAADMIPQRKPKSKQDHEPTWDEGIVADSSEDDVSEEDLRRLEEVVRPEFEKGDWQVDDGPGW
jgi:hypothetical protein